MNQENLWQLFKNTGKIEYYLKYRELKKEYLKNDKTNGRNHR